MTSGAFDGVFGGAPRKPESKITQREMDLARSIQVFTEEALLKMVGYVHQETAMKNLCMAGGVALNCVANGRLLREGPFEEFWIQPAAGDAGGAVGIALAIWHRYLGKERISSERAGAWQARTNGNSTRSYSDGMKGSFLGPRDSVEEIERFLQSRGLPYSKHSREELPDVVAELLADEKIIGLHQGRMEFGPRALGARSILGDPRSPTLQKDLNLKVKYRESFRPFAPAVLREDVASWFDLDRDSPYMLLVGKVRDERCLMMTAEQEALWPFPVWRARR